VTQGIQTALSSKLQSLFNICAVGVSRNSRNGQKTKKNWEKIRK